MKLLLYLSILLYFITIQVKTQTTTEASQITALSTQCINGGSCVIGNLIEGICQRCNCLTGYRGLLCDETLIKVEGNMTYNVVNNQTGATSPNTTIVTQLLLNPSSGIQDVIVRAPVRNASSIRIILSLYLERSNALNLDKLSSRLRAQFSDNSIINAIFGVTNEMRLTNVLLDIDECFSSFHNCSSNALCSNSNPGYQCNCDLGYQGNGKTCQLVTCNLFDAPLTPSQATRSVAYNNGTILSNPTGELPFGTTVEFTCHKYYELVEFSTRNTAVTVAECGNEGWSGTPVTCAITLSFRIALIIVAISLLIIIAVTGCFITDHCVKKERRAKAQQSGDDLNVGLERSFNNVQ